MHPVLLAGWPAEVRAGRFALERPPLPGLAAGAGPGTAIIIAPVIFPQLALGLNGVETGVLHFHLVRGTRAWLSPSGLRAAIDAARVTRRTSSRSFSSSEEPP